MLKICLLFGTVLAFSSGADAQYYYKDLVSNRQVVADMKAYRDNKIRNIHIKSIEEDGTETPSFFCEKKISKDYKTTELFTRADISEASMFISKFDGDGKLLSTNDSSAISVTDVKYLYDSKNRISSIRSSVRSQDDDFHNIITEEHIYIYNEAGIPEKMMLVKNDRDTTPILFSADEAGNVAIEKNTKDGSKYLYYYDARKRLTDIVNQNEYTSKMKPDYMFEYNSAAQVTQMTTVQEGSSNYFIWKYNYDNGLRSRERCFSDERKLMGSVEYEYK